MSLFKVTLVIAALWLPNLIAFPNFSSDTISVRTVNLAQVSNIDKQGSKERIESENIRWKRGFFFPFFGFGYPFFPYYWGSPFFYGR
ncbi:hypothetical protein ANCCAN_27767 [Ancylostoma caninum]|uniref:Uncharacterized protein n=1 Tax=Ancylostoma caninum TaxID=29170 RepID=A0A368F337_ANCCA|nr:hypothetical protein ANCCAN_27767 [Ancylostoma caninum]